MRLARFLALVAGFCAAAAWAQQPATPFDEGALRTYVTQQVAAAAPQLTRFEVQFLPFTPRADLAACARTEPFLSMGSRPWGRLSLGVRCVEGASWTLMVPVQVRAWTLGLVAAEPLAAGTVPGEHDLREQEVELTRENAAVLRDPAALQGRALTRALLPGQPVRADMLRTVNVVQAGDPVRLRIAGAGFAVTATGQALTAAAEGRPLRVRTELGKVLTGIAREGRVVDIAL